MRSHAYVILICGFITGFGAAAIAQVEPADPISTMVGRLDLDRYKATVKGLTQFGDRRQGTDRNRAAVDWIEAQLKSYGCPTGRIAYAYDPPPPNPAGGRGSWQYRSGAGRRPAQRREDADRREHGPDEAARRNASRAQHAADDAGAARDGVLHQGRHHSPGGDVHRRRPHGRPRLGRSGERRWVRHRAGDGSRARLQQSGRAHRAHDPIRALEQRGNGIAGRTAYIAQRQDLQGKESPSGSAGFPNRNGSG